MLKTTLLVTGLLFASNAYADDVIIRRDAPDVVPAPAPMTSTTVEKHGRDCDSKTVHTENDAGDSKTVTQTDCD